MTVDTPEAVWTWNEPCRKCGALMPALKYFADGSIEGVHVHGAGVLRVTCGKCGYTWLRLPLDAANEKTA